MSFFGNKISIVYQYENTTGTGDGGHIFYSSNDTHAPIETAKIDTNGMTITQDNDSSNLGENSLSIANTSSNNNIALSNK